MFVRRNYSNDAVLNLNNKDAIMEKISSIFKNFTEILSRGDSMCFLGVSTSCYIINWCFV